MSFKQELDTLLTKHMSRKEFLKHLCFAIASIVGINALIKTVNIMNTDPSDASKVGQLPKKKSGYSRSGYGSKLES